MNRDKIIKELAENIVKQAETAETPDKVEQAARYLIIIAESEKKHSAALLQMWRICTEYERYKRRQGLKQLSTILYYLPEQLRKNVAANNLQRAYKRQHTR